MNKNKKTDKSIDYIESERAFLEGLTGKPVSRYKAQDITDDIDKLFRSLSKIEQGNTINVSPEQVEKQTI